MQEKNLKIYSKQINIIYVRISFQSELGIAVIIFDLIHIKFKVNFHCQSLIPNWKQKLVRFFDNSKLCLQSQVFFLMNFNGTASRIAKEAMTAKKSFKEFHFLSISRCLKRIRLCRLCEDYLNLLLASLNFIVFFLSFFHKCGKSKSKMKSIKDFSSCIKQQKKIMMMLMQNSFLYHLRISR